MDRVWNIHQLFCLLVVSFWYEGTAAGLDMEDVYDELTVRLGENLLTRMGLL